jgi:glycosyltransferase involved in cell wall biosynthesis
MGLKVVVTYHGPDYERKKWPVPAKWVLRLGESLGCLFAHRVIAISQYLADSKLKGRARTEVIPNGVAMPEGAAGEGGIHAYGLEKQKYILAVARFVPEKALHDLISAFNIAKPEGHKLAIVGAADHQDDYSRGLAEQAKGNKDVVLTGFLSGRDLQEIYAHAGLFVLPSYYEGLPIALLEALSYGLSVIASDIPANREVGLPEERYFKPGAVRDLAQKLVEFSGKTLSPEQKAKQAALLKERYDWDDIARRTLKVYQQVMDDE